MFPHLMVYTTWEQVCTALVQEFGSNQTLFNQKQEFMAIQLKKNEATDDFAESFYQEAQVLLTCQKVTLDDAISTAISTMSVQPHLQLYIKGIKRSFQYISDIKEAILDNPPIFFHGWPFQNQNSWSFNQD